MNKKKITILIIILGIALIVFGLLMINNDNENNNKNPGEDTPVTPTPIPNEKLKTEIETKIKSIISSDLYCHLESDIKYENSCLFQYNFGSINDLTEDYKIVVSILSLHNDKKSIKINTEDNEYLIGDGYVANYYIDENDVKERYKTLFDGEMDTNNFESNLIKPLIQYDKESSRYYLSDWREPTDEHTMTTTKIRDIKDNGETVEVMLAVAFITPRDGKYLMYSQIDTSKI